MSAPTEVPLVPASSFEANVIVAGIEGAAVAWIGYTSIAGRSVVPTLPDNWHWFFAFYVAIGVVAIALLGLVVEGLTGLTEFVVVKYQRGERRGELREWYETRTLQPKDWGPAQRWMWTSPQAAQEFSRRRLRLLICRNTAFCLGILTVLLIAGFAVQRPWHWAWYALLSAVGGFLAVWLFGWLWIDTHRDWNRAVRDASKLDQPQPPHSKYGG